MLIVQMGGGLAARLADLTDHRVRSDLVAHGDPPLMRCA